jgi:hypothetical protein
MPTFHAYAATTPHSALQPFTFDRVNSVRKRSKSRCLTAGSATLISLCSTTNGACRNSRLFPDTKPSAPASPSAKKPRGSRLASVWASGGRLIAVSGVTSACPEITISARLIKAPWWAATAAFRIVCASNGPGHVRYPTGSISRKPVRCYAAAIPYSRLSLNTTYPRPHASG